MAFVLGQKFVKFAIAASALLSLLAGSVSACACSHHGEKAKAESPSCHSHTPEQLASPGNVSARSYDAECECMTAKPPPAIVARSDKKNADVHSETVRVAESVDFAQFVLVSIALPAIGSARGIYLSVERHRLIPARAPPRL